MRCEELGGGGGGHTRGVEGGCGKWSGRGGLSRKEYGV